MKSIIKNNNQEWFDTTYIKSNLKSKSISGGISTIGAQFISFLISTGSTVILARLLDPNDYGLIAMITSITGFILIFKDFGLSSAVVQHPDIDHAKASLIFWLNLIIGAVLGILVIAIGPLAADFFDEPRLVKISYFFSLSAFISSASGLHYAILKRQMLFLPLSYIHIIASFSGVAVGILMAYFGLGYWALVAIHVLSPFVSFILVLLICRWRPSKISFKTNIKPFVNFGIGMTGFDLINYFSRNMDNILIGRFLGAAVLGLYSKAYQLLMLPIVQLRNPLNSVGISALSSLQSDKIKFRQYYKKFVFILAFFSFPLVVYMGLFAKPLILVVLGDKWIDSAPIFQVLSIAAFIQPVASTRGLVLISLGKTKKYFIWGLANAIFVTGGFLIG
ncbi:MAG: lipopolysaccharide biosynthesis protein, partial [Cyclobacteriaceae bacterium]